MFVIVYSLETEKSSLQCKNTFISFSPMCNKYEWNKNKLFPLIMFIVASDMLH